MDVFKLLEQLIDDYSTHTRSFIKITYQRVHEGVARELDVGVLWPDPLKKWASILELEV